MINISEQLGWIKAHWRWILAGGGGLAIVILLGTPLLRTHQTSNQNVPSQAKAISSKSASSQSNTSSQIKVDIKGAVNRPGLYEINADQRLQNLIQQAGGLTDQADTKQINLAQKLTDGQAIYLPYQGEQLGNSSEIMSATVGTQGNINLNSASLQELQQLDGIGAKKAEKIIAYRQSHQGFKKIEDLKQVDGIGDKYFEKIKDQVTV